MVATPRGQDLTKRRRASAPRRARDVGQFGLQIRDQVRAGDMSDQTVPAGSYGGKLETRYSPVGDHRPSGAGTERSDGSPFVSGGRPSFFGVGQRKAGHPQPGPQLRPVDRAVAGNQEKQVVGVGSSYHQRLDDGADGNPLSGGGFLNTARPGKADDPVFQTRPCEFFETPIL